MTRLYTDYDCQANNFANLPDYSIHCGTDYLAVKEVPPIIKKFQPVKKILDLGCGSGLATRFLKQHFPDVSITGADINKRMLEQAVFSDPDGLYVHLPQSNDETLGQMDKHSCCIAFNRPNFRWRTLYSKNFSGGS